MAEPPLIPRATYRLQFRNGFGFADAERAVPYLADLGVSHLYASPIFKARAGSTHGYDAVDFNELDPALGDEAALDALCAALRSRGMGLLLDFVPNHMAAGSENPWWQDLLAKGQASAFAEFFDIDWQAGDGRLLLPELGGEPDEVLAAGELMLRLDPGAGALVLGYYDHRWPVSADDAAEILRRTAAPERVIDAFAQGRLGMAEDRLRAAIAATPGLGAAIERELAALNQDKAALAKLLDRQAYRLIHWRDGPKRLNYRRFFEIDDLVALRMDRDQVFDASHRLLLRLIGEQKVQGVRLDHVDGLLDPAAYCRRLVDAAANALGVPRPDADDLLEGRPIYLVVEKILGHGEDLPAKLAVAGTTGYEFMTALAGLMTDSAADEALAGAKAAFGDGRDFEAIAEEAKAEVLEASFPGELDRLAAALHDLARRHPPTEGCSAGSCRAALAALIVAFPVYRTYVDGEGATAEDRARIEQALAKAAIDPSVADLLRALLAGEVPAGSSIPSAAALGFAMRLQQLTGPVMAKAVEDTAFYRYVRLIALNEVGGAPGVAGGTIDDFHAWVERRRCRQPHGMLATATHDHKRGEEVRARLYALSEMPAAWRDAALRWQALNAGLIGLADGRRAPSLDDEYLNYQTVVGAWPPNLDTRDQPSLAAFAERLAAYMEKAGREAGKATSWTGVNQAYEAATAGFVRGLFDAEASAAFLREVVEFEARIAPSGVANSLAQALLKLTLPGVPDLYQGTEAGDLSLVDPDNRRPVDFAGLAEMLADRRWPKAPAAWSAGRAKQALIGRVLDLRRADPLLFERGDYLPIQVVGKAAGRVLAFARAFDRRALITVVPRLMAARHGDPADPSVAWAGTRLVLPDRLRTFRFTSRLVAGRPSVEPAGQPIAELAGDCPVALLTTGE